MLTAHDAQGLPSEKHSLSVWGCSAVRALELFVTYQENNSHYCCYLLLSTQYHVLCYLIFTTTPWGTC